MQRKLLLAVGLVSLFILTFVISIFLAFPTDSIRHLAESNLSKMSNGKQIFEIKEMSVSPLLNVTLKNMSMKPSTSEPTPEHLMTKEDTYSGYYCAKSVEVMPFLIDRIFINPSLYKTLTNLPTGTFEINVSDGTITGKLTSRPLSAEVEEEQAQEQEQARQEPEGDEQESARPKRRSRRNKASNDTDEKSADGAKTADTAIKQPSAKSKKAEPILMSLNAKGSKININRLTLVSNFTGAQLHGELDFDTRAQIENNKLKEMHLNLNMLSTALCPKRILLNNSIPYEIPFAILGDITADLTIQNGVLKIAKFQSTGPDIALDVQGTVTLPNDRIKEPNLNLSIKVLPSEAWLEANSMEIIYQYCRKQADGSVDIKFSGPPSRKKIDCGTPIPVEKPVVEKKPASDEQAEHKKEPDSAANDDEKAATPKKREDDQNNAKKKTVIDPPNSHVRSARPDRPAIDRIPKADDKLRHIELRGASDEEIRQIANNPKALKALRDVEATAEADFNRKHHQRLDIDPSAMPAPPLRASQREERARRPKRN